MDQEALLSQDIMNLLEVEPSSGSEGGVVPALSAPGPDIPALRKQLAVLVSTGNAKEAIGVQLTHEQVKRLSNKDVKKYTKRYEAYVGSKTTEKHDRQQHFSRKQSGRNVRQNQRHGSL